MAMHSRYRFQKESYTLFHHHFFLHKLPSDIGAKVSEPQRKVTRRNENLSSSSSSKSSKPNLKSRSNNKRTLPTQLETPLSPPSCLDTLPSPPTTQNVTTAPSSKKRKVRSTYRPWDQDARKLWWTKWKTLLQSNKKKLKKKPNKTKESSQNISWKMVYE